MTRSRIARSLFGSEEDPDKACAAVSVPFHALVEDHRDLLCGTNLALAHGMLAGLADDRATARLDPQPGLGCVAIAQGATRGADS